MTRRRARHEVRGRGRDDDQLSGPREMDVIECVTSLDQFCVNRSPGEGLERYGADELRRRPGEHHIDFRRRLREKPRQPR